MKFRKFYLTAISASLFMLASCGSTSKVETPAVQQETEEIPQQQAQNTVDSAEQTPEVTQEQSSTNQDEDLQKDNPLTHIIQQNSEKVSEEDESFNKESEKAPTTEEASKVSEPDIFEEPEVKDLPLPELPPEIIAEPEVVVEPTVESEEKAPVNPAVEEIPVKDIPQQETEENMEEPSETATETEEVNSENAEAEEEKPEIIPSRKVTLKKNQYLDVIYPGKGWTYLGEEEELGLVKYFGRRIVPGNTTFTLRSAKAGTTLLHFYKNDGLTEDYIDDYLLVEILDETNRGTVHAKAPSYADIVPAKPARKAMAEKEAAAQQTEAVSTPKATESVLKAENSEKETAAEKTVPVQKAASAEVKPASENNGTPAAASNTEIPENSDKPEIKDDIKTVISTTESVKTQPSTNESSQVEAVSMSSSAIQPEPEVIVENKEEVQVEDITNYADESILDKAKKLYEEKKYEEALKYASNYANSASTRLDEAYYLLGQIYEADSPVKNIRNSVDAYTTVVKRYGASKLWKPSNQRAIYLKRFYIDIR